MKRPARSLLSVSVLAPAVAVAAVAAAPVGAVAQAAPPAPAGPSTTLLHAAAAAAAPATAPLPAQVTGPAGRTAQQVTGTVDRALRTASSTPSLGSGSAGPGLRNAPGLRTASNAPGLGSVSGRPCALSPRKVIKKHTGAQLPRTSLPSAAKGPLKGVPQGHCIAAGRRVATPRKPAPADPVTRVSDAVLEDAGKVGGKLNASRLGGLPGVTSLPGRRRAGSERRAGSPLSLPVPDAASALGGANPRGVRLGSTLSPSADRIARPHPRPRPRRKPRHGDVIGQANGVVNGVGNAVTKSAGVGGVLKPHGRAGNTDGGPLSLTDAATGITVRGLPGVR
ncbi:hypothetical protein [Actinomadura decatromicini]|uniref:Uncharacterized protein n=1 Tax=Actinomadura decatromicini TaxID=2604572 RepID=A0A5D3FPR9_9ACTN|nr:hypothetical protein [Actinomadura decatromicini]TYK50817.1 hypothetical protein FXF68_10110 [Actinomadura decatromicini]